MFGDVKEMLSYIKKANVESLDFKYTDLFGRWRHVILPTYSLDEEVFSKGVGFDASSMPGFTKLESGDMVLLPVPDTAFVDPFHSVPTLAVICRIVLADTLEAYERDPRGIAIRAEEYLAQCGLADTSRWGPEFEFYVFRSVRFRNNHAAFEAELEPMQAQTGCVPANSDQAYHYEQPLDATVRLRERICSELHKAGLKVKYHHHEVGSLGQCEIELPLGPLVQQADGCQIVKYFTRMCAWEEGLVATFMPKPLFGKAGSGMHFHQCLWHKGEPLFYDASGYAGLHRRAVEYTAGILHHGRALVGLTNPSTNSYKRLVPGFEAPVNLFFSQGNRSAAVRIPQYATDAVSKRIEFRPPDATCNPYLAMAGMLMAGIDGMQRHLDPQKMGMGPYDEDVFTWTEERRNRIQPLPRTLDEALTSLEEDAEFLWAGKVFPEDLLAAYIERKRTLECREMRNRPHPYEFELYLHC